MAESPRCVKRSVQVYRTLIRLYPASFRAEFGDEMVHVFRNLATDAWQQRQRAGLMLVWLRVVADLVRTAPKQHLSSWNSNDGGFAMSLKSLLTRRFLSDDIERQYCRIAVPGFAILFSSLFVWRLLSMNMTTPQLLLGILLTIDMAIKAIGLGLLQSRRGQDDRSRLLPGVAQIVVFTMSGLVMIGGIWTLAFLTLTETEWFLGLLLTFDLMGTGFLIGEVLPILQGARTQRRESQTPCS